MVELVKVRSEENPAKLFTKHLTWRHRIYHLLELFRCRYVSGRAAIAPWLRAVAVTTEGEFLNVAQHTMTTRFFQQWSSKQDCCWRRSRAMLECCRTCNRATGWRHKGSKGDCRQRDGGC